MVVSWDRGASRCVSASTLSFDSIRSSFWNSFLAGRVKAIWCYIALAAVVQRASSLIKQFVCPGTAIVVVAQPAMAQMEVAEPMYGYKLPRNAVAV